jgi:hypothetical protein
VSIRGTVMLPRRRHEDRGWRERPVCAVEKRLSLVFRAFGDTELPEDSGPPRRDIPKLFWIPTLTKPSLKRRAPEPAAGSGATLQRPPRFVSCSDGSNERKERTRFTSILLAPCSPRPSRPRGDSTRVPGSRYFQRLDESRHNRLGRGCDAWECSSARGDIS